MSSPAALPLTRIVSEPSGTSSGSGVSVKLTVPVLFPGGIVSGNGASAAKSVPETAVLPAAPTSTDTTVACSIGAPFNWAITSITVGSPPSSTTAGSTDKDTDVDGASLSFSARIAPSTVIRFAAPFTAIVSSPSVISSSTGRNEKVRVAVRVPRGISRTKSPTAW